MEKDWCPMTTGNYKHTGRQVRRSRQTSKIILRPEQAFSCLIRENNRRRRRRRRRRKEKSIS
jgi:hypothetical protein